LFYYWKYVQGCNTDRHFTDKSVTKAYWKMFIMSDSRTVWFHAGQVDISVNSANLYSRAAQCQSQMGHQLSWVVLIKATAKEYLRLGQTIISSTCFATDIPIIILSINNC
jgi:hypothetical protein